jgi:poly(3-hydroxybutyrate) depolymerase
MHERIVAEVLSLTNASPGPLHLSGYSGGGQFVHRFMLVHPGRVARVAVGAAGWYTFPDPALDWSIPAGSSRGPISPA